MKRVRALIALYLSLWHSLLALACIILIYLTGVHMSEAIHTSSLFTFFNSGHASITWKPSRGTVDHYLLEITDTRLIGGEKSAVRNRLTTTSHVTSAVPGYRLDCFNNHSYQVRIKAVSPTGASSDYSEPSILFICDRESPKLSMPSLPCTVHKVRSQHITVRGCFDEPHIDTLAINDTAATIDHHNNTFSADLTLGPGENRVEVYARDLAGNTTTEHSVITYAPITILSIPGNAHLYWNGNYAYPGVYGGLTPRAYNHAGQYKQTIRISFPGFQDFFGIIDFSDLSRDSYVISLVPHVASEFRQLDKLLSPAEELPLPIFSPHPFVVDFNLDGRTDLLIGNADGTISAYFNRDGHDFPLPSDRVLLTAGDRPIDVGSNAAPFMVDFDNNGTFDLLTGNGDGHLYCYLNRGAATAPAFSAPFLITAFDDTPLTVEGDCTPWIADWNGDSRKDLLLGSGSGALMVSINVGSDSAPLFSPLRPVSAAGRPIEVDGPATPCVTDWNADGRPDVLMGTGNGTVRVYYATDGTSDTGIAEGASIRFNGQPLVIEGALAPFPVDWNRDGKNELVLGGGDGTVYLLE